MKTGARGSFVISWSQTETDGVISAPLDALSPGVTWRWDAEALRIDGPADLLRLEGAEGAAEMKGRAARRLRRLLGLALPQQPPLDGAETLPDQGFAVTDGHRSWVVRLLGPGQAGDLLLLLPGDGPPRGRDLWVTEVAINRRRAQGPRAPQGVICFTPGTLIATPQGPRRIETLRPGDPVLTRDAGPQPLVWTGHRRLTGARLHSMPRLRPIRLRAAALGRGQPQPDLLVSPQHRLLITGPAARALFSCDEVLVRAEDLLNDRTILVDRQVREVTYVHLLLETHHVIEANGLWTESFHPAQAALDSLEPPQRDQLRAVLPDPAAYGACARRNLTGAEAAILRHDLSL